MSECILSGLKIRKGCSSIEHLIPKSRADRIITLDRRNMFPADKIVNCIKASFLPCEFEEVKYNLTYHALEAWKLRGSDREFLQRTMINWEKNYKPDWCNICLLNCKGRQK